MERINLFAIGGKIEPETKFRFPLLPDFEKVETLTTDAEQK